jgi:bis(5'-nucleosidyl)-tetraphosphatase
VRESKTETNLKLPSKEFLLEEYKYLCDSFWKNEETGEKRVQFFITLVTAVLAALATLFPKAIEKDCINDVLGIILFTLVALIIFGVITLLRIAKRNEVTDGYKKDLDEIRQRFKDFFDKSGVLSGYEPFKGSTKDKYAIRKIGGLAHTVAAINSVILAAVAVVIFLMAAFSIFTVSFLASLVFLIGFVAQVYWIKKRDKQSKEDFKKSQLSHAGGIVWKKIDSKPHFLLVTAKKTPSHWVFPKGHIKENEDPAEAALREVMEESGIKAYINGTVGYGKYSTEKEMVRVKFYLMEYLSEQKGKPTEPRDKKWCSFDDAMALLSFEDSRRLLRFAKCRLEELKGIKSD